MRSGKMFGHLVSNGKYLKILVEGTIEGTEG